jgi:hypothetical protein
VVSRLKLILIVPVLLVVCAGPVSAQQITTQSEPSAPGLRLPTTVFASAAAADWATTYYGIKHFQLRETNPLLRRFDRTPAKMVLLGAAIDVGAVAAWNYTMGRKHPRVAAAGLWTMTAFRAYLAFHNSRNIQRSARRQ